MTIQEMHKQHSRFLYKVALRYAKKNHELAQDLVQNVWLNATKGFNTYIPCGDGRSWLYSILRNTASNFYRKDGKLDMVGFNVRLLDSREKNNWTMKESEIIDNSLSQEDQLYYKELGKILEKTINKIPKPYKEAAELFFCHRLQYEEISNVLDISVGTVKSRISRARNFLQKELKEVAGR